MQLLNTVEHLNRLAESHNARRTMQLVGWYGIVFGMVNMSLGTFFVLALGPINAVLVLSSLLLLVSGVSCLVTPGAPGFLCNAIAQILVGLWNILVAIFIIVVKGLPQFWWAAWACFGVCMIVVGVQCIWKLARCSAALNHKATKDELAMMDSLVETILNATAKDNEDIVTIRVNDNRVRREWHGQLCQNMAIFVDRFSKEILVAAREDVSIEPYGKLFFLDKTIKASVRIKDEMWAATMWPTSFDHYRRWKFAENEDKHDHKYERDADKRKPETGIQAKDKGDEESPTGIKRRPPTEEEESGAETD